MVIHNKIMKKYILAKRLKTCLKPQFGTVLCQESTQPHLSKTASVRPYHKTTSKVFTKWEWVPATTKEPKLVSLLPWPSKPCSREDNTDILLCLGRSAVQPIPNHTYSSWSGGYASHIRQPSSTSCQISAGIQKEYYISHIPS